MLTKIILLSAGGMAGTLARYGLSGLTHRLYGGFFPLGTLVVNLAGAFCIGLVWSLTEDVPLSPSVRSLVFIGLLGGFTTFSSFMLESLHLLRDGEIGWAVLNLVAQNVLGLVAVFGGFLLGQKWSPGGWV